MLATLDQLRSSVIWLWIAVLLLLTALVTVVICLWLGRRNGNFGSITADGVTVRTGGGITWTHTRGAFSSTPPEDVQVAGAGVATPEPDAASPSSIDCTGHTTHTYADLSLLVPTGGSVPFGARGGCEILHAYLPALDRGGFTPTVDGQKFDLYNRAQAGLEGAASANVLVHTRGGGDEFHMPSAGVADSDHTTLTLLPGQHVSIVAFKELDHHDWDVI